MSITPLVPGKPAGRPLTVTLAALLPVGLALWWLVFMLAPAALSAVSVVQEAGVSGPLEVYLGPALLLLVSFAVVRWCFATASGLRRGARWSRWSALALAMLAFPASYPSDLTAAALLGALLFLEPGARAFFRKPRPEAV